MKNSSKKKRDEKIHNVPASCQARRTMIGMQSFSLYRASRRSRRSDSMSIRTGAAVDAARLATTMRTAAGRAATTRAPAKVRRAVTADARRREDRTRGAATINAIVHTREVRGEGALGRWGRVIERGVVGRGWDEGDEGELEDELTQSRGFFLLCHHGDPAGRVELTVLSHPTCKAPILFPGLDVAAARHGIGSVNVDVASARSCFCSHARAWRACMP